MGLGALSVPLAAVLSWILKLRGLEVPSYLEASVGAILAVFLICLEDGAAMVNDIIRKRLGLPDAD